MAFAGHMNIELIQPNNSAPSVYREVIERRGYGFIIGASAPGILTVTWSVIVPQGMSSPFSPRCRAVDA